MLTKDEKWAARHFDKLVSKYGGFYIGIYKGRVVSKAKTPKEVVRKSRLINPQSLYLFKVPTRKELVCLL